MARTTGSDGARTEEAIREAAVALIAARGFEATTLREIADKVGVQPGTIYRYFPSKAQLLVALLVEHLEYLLASWATAQPRTDDPVERLRAFVAFHIRSHTLRRREVFVANMELRSLSPGDRARVVALRRRYEDLLTGILRDGMARGVGAWSREAGGLDKHALTATYARLTLQCAGAEPAPAAATARAARRQAPSLTKTTA